MGRRSLTVAAITAAAVFGASAPAFAHECYIENRSEQGNAGASNSTRWATVTIEGFAQSPDFPPGFDPDCFVDEWLTNGGPAGFTVRIDKTIGEGSANPNLANGSGLEHIEDVWGALFLQSLAACEL